MYNLIVSFQTSNSEKFIRTGDLARIEANVCSVTKRAKKPTAEEIKGSSEGVVYKVCLLSRTLTRLNQYHRYLTRGLLSLWIHQILLKM